MALTTFTGIGESVQSHLEPRNQQLRAEAHGEESNAILRTLASLTDDCCVNKRPSLRGDLHPLMCAFFCRPKLEERCQILGNSLSLFINRNDVITVIQQHQFSIR